MFLLHLFFCFVVVDTLTSSKILFGVMSGTLSFIFDCPRQYARQLSILTNGIGITALGVYLVLVPKDLVGSLLIGWLKI